MLSIRVKVNIEKSQRLDGVFDEDDFSTEKDKLPYESLSATNTLDCVLEADCSNQCCRQVVQFAENELEVSILLKNLINHSRFSLVQSII